MAERNEHSQVSEPAMSHVFVSYKREDEARVVRLAQALHAEGLDVWWDRGTPGGASWYAGIEAKLRDAGCVVVVWSSHCATGENGFIRDEAHRGLSRNILVPVLIDRVGHLPLEFGDVHALDLTRWRGDRRDADFQDVVAAVRARLADKAVPSPKAPKQRVARRLLWSGVSAAVLAVVAALAFDTLGVATGLCTLRGSQSGLSDACGAFGMGGRPDRTEREAWEARNAGSCADLREHIQRFPDGAFRSKAASLLMARKIAVIETWQPTTRKLALFVPALDTPSKNERSARANALERGERDAQRLCRTFGGGALYRYVSATPLAEQWSCAPNDWGIACGFEGHAECELSERHQTEEEHCD